MLPAIFFGHVPAKVKRLSESARTIGVLRVRLETWRS